MGRHEQTGGLVSRHDFVVYDDPNACFDWWGYSNQYDPNYALKSGLQMSVLYAMVQANAPKTAQTAG
jgi:hypothetical protein